MIRGAVPSRQCVNDDGGEANGSGTSFMEEISFDFYDTFLFFSEEEHVYTARLDQRFERKFKLRRRYHVSTFSPSIRSLLPYSRSVR